MAPISIPAKSKLVIFWICLQGLDDKYTKKMLQINIKSMVVVDNDTPKNTDIDPDDDSEFDLSMLEECKG